MLYKTSYYFPLYSTFLIDDGNHHFGLPIVYPYTLNLCCSLPLCILYQYSLLSICCQCRVICIVQLTRRPVLYIRDSASSTAMKGKNLKISPWWTPAFTSDSSLITLMYLSRSAWSSIHCHSHLYNAVISGRHPRNLLHCRSWHPVQSFFQVCRHHLQLSLLPRCCSCGCVTIKMTVNVPLSGGEMTCISLISYFVLSLNLPELSLLPSVDVLKFSSL